MHMHSHTGRISHLTDRLQVNAQIKWAYTSTIRIAQIPAKLPLILQHI